MMKLELSVQKVKSKQKGTVGYKRFFWPWMGRWWALEDLNLRLPACEAGVLPLN